MAFGDLKGTLVATTLNLPNPFNAVGSVSVAVGDLIVCVLGERVDRTLSAVNDNLGHSYAAQNAGTDAGAATGTAYWVIATSAGTLTSVSCTVTAGANDGAVGVGVYEGPFAASPLDRNPANLTDSASPYLGPATGTLAQADELIIAWWTAANGVNTAAIGGGFSLDTNQASGTGANSISMALAHLVVAATTTVTPSWTAGTSPATCVEGTCSFKKLLVTFTYANLVLTSNDLVRYRTEIVGY